MLAGIGQVETDHGANKNVSSAGAMGPMQFMPATWAAYGVDGDGDGKADILNQTDAVYSAAHYLCVERRRQQRLAVQGDLRLQPLQLLREHRPATGRPVQVAPAHQATVPVDA